MVSLKTELIIEDENIAANDTRPTHTLTQNETHDIKPELSILRYGKDIEIKTEVQCQLYVRGDNVFTNNDIKESENVENSTQCGEKFDQTNNFLEEKIDITEVKLEISSSSYSSVHREISRIKEDNPQELKVILKDCLYHSESGQKVILNGLTILLMHVECNSGKLANSDHERLSINKDDSNRSKIVNQKPKIYVCKQCNFKSKHRSTISRHRIIHENKENAIKYFCHKCSYKTMHKRYLISHQLTHDKLTSVVENLIVCKFCSKNFKQKRQLYSHFLNCHKNDITNLEEVITQKIYKCSLCSYQTVKVDHLNQHQLTHEKNLNASKRFVCDSCKYTTYRRCDFVKHVKIHCDDKSYCCSTCDKGFNQKGHLDSHVLRHHGSNDDVIRSISNKVYECPKCSYKCIGTCGMKSHVGGRFCRLE